MPLDRKPIDLCRKVVHGVLYTAHRLVSFGLNVPPDCLCGHCDETLEPLFFHCPLAQRGLIGFSHYSFCPLLLHQLLPCVMFSSVSAMP